MLILTLLCKSLTVAAATKVPNYLRQVVASKRNQISSHHQLQTLTVQGPPFKELTLN